jgi:phosphoribosyl 1,2-cyclic phosphodiesterase
MRVRFWGTRGSLPVSLTSRDLRDRLAQVLVLASTERLDTVEKACEFIERLDFQLTHTFGGHTSCVEIEDGGDEYYVCDMGSGARAFGAHVLARQAGRPATVNVFMSHMHWDHIMGFPFFGPAYAPEHRVRIYGCHEGLEHAFRLQQEPPCFPVPFSQLGATIEFVPLVVGRAQRVGSLTVTPKLQFHSGDSYGFRFEGRGRSFVYTTDSEHRLDEDERSSIVEFFREADLVAFDAMYSLAEAVSVKADWGHSSNVVAVELCQLAKVKALALFHHEPANDDLAINRILRDARRLEELTRERHAMEVIAAYDGLEIDL